MSVVSSPHNEKSQVFSLYLKAALYNQRFLESFWDIWGQRICSICAVDACVWISLPSHSTTNWTTSLRLWEWAQFFPTIKNPNQKNDLITKLFFIRASDALVRAVFVASLFHKVKCLLDLRWSVNFSVAWSSRLTGLSIKALISEWPSEKEVHILHSQIFLHKRSLLTKNKIQEMFQTKTLIELWYI